MVTTGNICCDSGVGVPDVGYIVDVIDGCGDVEGLVHALSLEGLARPDGGRLQSSAPDYMGVTRRARWLFDSKRTSSRAEAVDHARRESAARWTTWAGSYCPPSFAAPSTSARATTSTSPSKRIGSSYR